MFNHAQVLDHADVESHVSHVEDPKTGYFEDQLETAPWRLEC